MTDNSPAPIALFAYKRPAHLRRTLAALAANPEARHSALHVFCDGAKSEADAAAVAEVREIACNVAGFATVQVHARERNAGLAQSIIEGVGRMLEAHNSVIVVEDDLVVSLHFLRYMHEGLALYAGDEQVASIHGYCYPLQDTLPATFFLRGADCWGWATWARAWRHFDANGAALLAQLRARRLAQVFDLDGAYPYTRMLEDQIAGRNDSWAIRWHASAFLAGLLTLYPGRSLVRNIGHDGSGTHSGEVGSYQAQDLGGRVPVVRIAPCEDAQARQRIAAFLRAGAARPPAHRWLQVLARRTWFSRA